MIQLIMKFLNNVDSDRTVSNVHRFFFDKKIMPQIWFFPFLFDLDQGRVKNIKQNLALKNNIKQIAFS